MPVARVGKDNWRTLPRLAIVSHRLLRRLLCLSCRYWRELHALRITRSKVQLLACLGRQRHKAINQLMLTS